MKMVLSLLYKIYLSLSKIIRTAYVATQVKSFTPPNVLGKVYINAKNVKIGKNVTFYPGVYLWGNDIEIGDNVDIGIGTIIYSKNGIRIGNNTNIAGQCYIIDSNHGTKKDRLIREQADDAAPNGIYIGDDVWIGAQCSILKGAQIEKGAVIGAQTMVNKPVPAYAIVAGTPFKIIKYRN